MASVEDRLKTLERQVAQFRDVGAAVQGQPASATISIPHNDSWLFENNVDATHPGNLRYVISTNIQRVFSARLSIHLAPYQTYNSLTFSATGGQSQTHTHGMTHSHSHGHTWSIADGTGGTATLWQAGGGAGPVKDNSGITSNIGTTTDGTGSSSGSTGNANVDHTHSISGSSTLGVTEGAVASGVAISFDGVDQTAALAGPFNADMIEINVLPYLAVARGVFHVIAMTPSGLGRIEAHLRLGVYVAAGSVF